MKDVLHDPIESLLKSKLVVSFGSVLILLYQQHMAIGEALKYKKNITCVWKRRPKSVLMYLTDLIVNNITVVCIV